MAKCFDVVGYVEPCNAVRQKYTGRALLIMGNTTGNAAVEFTFSDNGIKVSGIDGENTYTAAEIKKLPLIINAENPFGVTVQENTDSGRVMYTKTIPVSIPAMFDGKAEEFIMGFQKELGVNSAIVLETFGGNSEVNDIFGTYSPVRIDPASVTRSEYENGGSWQFNLVCEEPVPNVICTVSGIREALDSLNA